MEWQSDGDQDAQQNAAPLWTMRHGAYIARCAVVSLGDGWELRVLVDGTSLLTERCADAIQALEVAERWKRRLLDRAWQHTLDAACCDRTR